MKTCMTACSGSGVCGNGSHYSVSMPALDLRVALDNLDLESFKASITKKNSTAQYSFRTSDWSGGTLLMVRAIYSAGLSTALGRPREHVKFGHRYLSEKAIGCLLGIHWIHA